MVSACMKLSLGSERKSEAKQVMIYLQLRSKRFRVSRT